MCALSKICHGVSAMRVGRVRRPLTTGFCVFAWDYHPGNNGVPGARKENQGRLRATQ